LIEVNLDPEEQQKELEKNARCSSGKKERSTILLEKKEGGDSLGGIPHCTCEHESRTVLDKESDREKGLGSVGARDNALMG